MRRLATILAGGLVAFLALSMSQEWSVFAPWLGWARPATVAVSEADRAGAEAALRELLALERHFYGTGGDPRFLDRLPAGRGITDELAADVDYLSRNGRFQEPSLIQLEILEVRALAAQAIEIRTKEYWIVRTRFLSDGDESEPARAEVSHLRYVVVREGSVWRVESRDFVEPPAAEVKAD